MPFGGVAGADDAAGAPCPARVWERCRFGANGDHGACRGVHIPLAENGGECSRDSGRARVEDASRSSRPPGTAGTGQPAPDPFRPASSDAGGVGRSIRSDVRDSHRAAPHRGDLGPFGHSAHLGSEPRRVPAHRHARVRDHRDAPQGRLRCGGRGLAPAAAYRRCRPEPCQAQGFLPQPGDDGGAAAAAMGGSGGQRRAR